MQVRHLSTVRMCTGHTNASMNKEGMPARSVVVVLRFKVMELVLVGNVHPSSSKF